MIRALRAYFRQVAGQLAIGSAAAIVSNSAVVLPAVLLGRALDAVIAWHGGHGDAAAAAHAIAWYVAGVGLVEVPRIGRRWWLPTANSRVRANLRADAMRGILGWPLARLHGTATGDLMARVIGDVEVVGVGVRTLTIDVWDTWLSAAVTLGALLAYDARLTAEALAPMPLAMALAHATGRWVRRRTAVAREANARLTEALQERLAGARLLRLLGRADAAVGLVRGLADAQARANLAVVRLREGLVPLYSVLMTAGVVIVIWRGGLRVVAGAMSVGSFVAYLSLFRRFADRGHRLPRFLNRLHGAAAGWERIAPLLAPPVSPATEPRYASFMTHRVAGEDAPAGRPATSAGGPVEVAIRDLTFHYPAAAAPALMGLSLDLPPGSFVAVTGPVGSGKSALARVVLGLYPSEAGEVRWDGTPVDRVPEAVRAARAGYLPQDPGVFSGSVTENILMRWGEDGGGSEDGRASAARAGLEEDLAGFPAGMATPIGEGGVRVSGGQRQRIALARALAVALPGAPGLLVLDDPFAAVDVETEARIVRALVSHHGPGAPAERRTTILLLSHRLAAFPLASRVIVLARGRIAEAGTHEELLRAGGLYARIFRAQARAA